MKKLLSIFALFLTCIFHAHAQSVDTFAMYSAQVDTMTVALTAPIGTECYVAYYVNDPSIILQVALATEGAMLTDSAINDDSNTATIYIKGRVVIKCFQVLKNMPEGNCADENKKLLTALMPSIMSSPALAYVITKLRNDNIATVMGIKHSGADKVLELQKLLY